MKVSFFETGRYRAPRALPPEWPVPSGAYDREAGAQAYQGIIERLEYVEAVGFDWVSVSEHHYSPRILTPAPIVTAAYIAARLRKITIALLGPIVPQSNPCAWPRSWPCSTTWPRVAWSWGCCAGRPTSP